MGKNIKRNILWITRTAIFVALLVTMQFFTALLGNQFVTGSVVNLMLIISLLTCGLATSLTVAVISPICAFLVGIGPAFPPLVPFIVLGNVSLIVTWFLLGRINQFDKSGIRNKVMGYLTAIAAAVIKFLTLYAGIVLLAVPYILNLNEKQSAILSFTFSYPQFITAAIGGVIALAAWSPIQKALKSTDRIA